MRVACLGIGLMGEPMAGNLLQNGHSVVIAAHRNRDPIARLVAKGAIEVANPAEAAARSDAALLILPTSREVEEVIFGSEGIVSAMKPSYTLVDMGTCLPADTRRLAARVKAIGARFLDAPVSGGVEGARAGTLTVMVGGEASVLDSVRPLLQSVGRDIHHFGEIGAGHTAKLIQNMIGWIEVAGVAEGLALCKATGLDLNMFFTMLSSSHSNSPIVQWMVPKVFAGAFDNVEFRLDLAHKDIRQAVALAGEESRLPLNVASAATELFQLARGLGFGAQDSTAVIRGLERILGSEVRAPVAAPIEPLRS
jgi:3-hydroxyisobutyrate dehydrogenase-like beta-hydroxyacid dehydrogenase